MEIRPVKTKADYKAALKEVSGLMETHPALGTPDGDRPLTLPMIRKLHTELGIPAESLIRPPARPEQALDCD